MNIFYITSSTIPSNKANAIHVINMSIALISLGHNVNLCIQSSCKSTKQYLMLNYGDMTKFINVISSRSYSNKGVELFISTRAILYYFINKNYSKSFTILCRNIFAAFFFGVILGKKIVYETHTLENNYIRKSIQRLLLKQYCTP